MDTSPSINETIENFYMSTHIPLGAYKLNGEIISSIAYKENFKGMIEEGKVFQKGRDELFRNKKNSYVNINVLENISFTVTYFCLKNLDIGIFIMGPYSSCSCKGNGEILYKPSNCIPHLVSLLHNLKKDSCSNGLRLSRKSEILHSPSIKRALDYIDEEYSNPITLDEIATLLNINRCYFCTLFKKEVNKTFTQYLNEVRIEKSKKLLSNNKLSILEIALTIGFNNPNYYSMVFKKLTNKTPLQYRREVI